MSDLTTPAALAKKRKVIGAVQALDPNVPEEAISAALGEAVQSLNGLAQLAGQVADAPDVLLGSPKATSSTFRLIFKLIEAGAENLALPRCETCGREAEKRYRDGRICKRCYSAHHLCVECSWCGRRRTITARTEAGEPVCNSCWVRDPKNLEVCSVCGGLSVVNARAEDGGAICRRCYDDRLAPLDACDVCGELARINSRKGGRIVCRRCYESPKRPCGKCSRVRVIALRATADTPDICNSCANQRTTVCGRCGEEGSCAGAKANRPLCLRCRLTDRVDKILKGPDGDVPVELRKLRDTIVASRNPKSGFQWLHRSPVGGTLKKLASGELPLSHETLDQMPDKVWLRHLREVLIASGALPERNADLLYLERRISKVAAGVRNTEDGYILKTFGVWSILGRVRRRLERDEDNAYTMRNARRKFLEAARFVCWLDGFGKEVSDCTQADVDAYLSGGTKARLIVRHFIVWAVQQGVLGNTISVPTVHGRGEPTSRVDFGARLSAARRLLRDDSLDASQRMAGALVVIYAQPVARVARLTLDDVGLHEGQVYLRLGKEAVFMPDPLGSLLLERTWRRRGGVAGALADDSDWLFPGAQPSGHVHPEHLRRRLADLGIESRQSRNTALTQLAAEVPAAILAETLGIHPTTAVRWVERAGGNWADYVAQRIR